MIGAATLRVVATQSTGSVVLWWAVRRIKGQVLRD